MNRIGITNQNMGTPLDELIDGPKGFEVTGSDRKQIAREDMQAAPMIAPEILPQTREAMYAAFGRRGLRMLDAHIPIPEYRSAQPGRAAHAGDAPWRAQ